MSVCGFFKQRRRKDNAGKEGVIQIQGKNDSVPLDVQVLIKGEKRRPWLIFIVGHIFKLNQHLNSVSNLLLRLMCPERV